MNDDCIVYYEALRVNARVIVGVGRICLCRFLHVFLTEIVSIRSYNTSKH